MKILSKYVLKRWLISFVATCMIVSGILLLEDVYKNFLFFIKAGIPTISLLKYCGMLTVGLLPISIPIAMFIATLFSLGQLHRNNEIVAMRSAGMNLINITRPVITSGIFIAACSVILEMTIVPHAIHYVTQFRVAADALSHYSTTVNSVGFRNNIDNIMWFIRSLNKSSNTANEVTLSYYDNNGNESKRIFANHARYDEKNKSWQLMNGHIMYFDNNAATPNNIELFDEHTLNDMREDVTTLLIATKKIKNLSFSEIRSAIKFINDDTYATPYLVRFHKTFANFATLILALCIAIPFAVTGVRVNPLVNISKACMVLLLFLFFNAMFSVLGNIGRISPIIAAWIGNFCMVFPAIKCFKSAL